MRGAEAAIRKLREHWCDDNDSELIGDAYEIAANHIEVTHGHAARVACSAEKVDDVAADILESMAACEKPRRRRR